MKPCIIGGRCPSEINTAEIPEIFKKIKEDRIMNQFPVHFLKEIDDITEYILTKYGKDPELRLMMCEFIRDTADYIRFLKNPYGEDDD